MGRLVESFKMILALEIALIVMLPKLVKKYKIGEIALYVPKYIRNVFVMFLINCFVIEVILGCPVTFPTPKSAYLYDHAQKNLIRIIEGNEIALSMYADGGIAYEVELKTDEGWKKGRGYKLKTGITQTNCNGEQWVIDVVKYSSREESFIIVTSWSHELEVTDSYSTEFYCENEDKQFVYYGVVPKIDEHYFLEVNGQKYSIDINKLSIFPPGWIWIERQ
ncbi:hypothetical protein ACQRAS_08260 [Coprococcus catus]